MNFPKNKNIVVITVPPTFVGERLCPLGMIPIGILKIVAFLKKKGNNVKYINMHSGITEDRALVSHIPAVKWKKKPMGLSGRRQAEMSIEGKSFEYLEKELKNVSFKPNEIWISCSFSFDYDLVKEYVDLCRDLWPSAIINVGGDFARGGYGVGDLVGADIVSAERISEADQCLPDFSCVPDWHYGLFQLQIGCVNKCSFCHINMDKPQFYSPDLIVNYMKEFNEKYHPKSFMNWDPNVALNRRQLTEFLEKYIDSGINVTLSFGKGLQPNLIDSSVLKLMNKARVNSVTIPMESASYEASKRLSKPYTIISSVKLLAAAKDAGLPLANCRCTSLLGYPDDDLQSFFRIYLTLLSFGASPSPFPVYLFPGAPDYFKFKPMLGNKDISAFHGQLWPLLPDEKIDSYLNLYKFIELTNMKSIQKNISLLSPEMRDVLGDEAGKFRKFTERCLNAKEDTLEEFRKINEDLDSSSVRSPLSERDNDRRNKKTVSDIKNKANENMKKIKQANKTSPLKNKKTNKKKTLLCIIANPGNPKRSVSKALCEYYLKEYKEKNKGAEIIKLYLPDEGLPFVNEEYVDYVYYGDHLKELSADTKTILALAEKYVSQLRAADEILIVSPMYTLSIPAILKAYFETIASYVYYYKEREMFSPKNVLCLISRDGVYPKSGRAADKNAAYLNAQETILAAALGFLGLSENPDFIDISNLFSRHLLPSVIASVKQRIDRYLEGDHSAAYRLDF